MKGEENSNTTLLQGIAISAKKKKGTEREEKEGIDFQMMSSLILTFIFFSVIAWV